jgi:hypothetical protein
MKYFKKSLVYIAVAALALGVSTLSFTVWKLEHPNAPNWIFFISNK